MYYYSPLEQFNVLYYLFQDPQYFILTNVHIFFTYILLLFVLYFIFTTSIKTFSHSSLWVQLIIKLHH